MIEEWQLHTCKSYEVGEAGEERTVRGGDRSSIKHSPAHQQPHKKPRAQPWGRKGSRGTELAPEGTVFCPSEPRMLEERGSSPTHPAAAGHTTFIAPRHSPGTQPSSCPPGPSVSPARALTGAADAAQAAVGGAAVQGVAGGSRPEGAVAAAAPGLAQPVAAAVGRVTARLVHAHHGGDAPGTAPHAVKGAGDSTGDSLSSPCTAQPNRHPLHNPQISS